MDIYQAHNHRHNQPGWKDILANIAESLLEKASSPIEEKIEEKRIQLGRKIYATGFIFIGLLFLLVGISIFLNQIFGQPWVGYAVAGTLFLLFGIIMKMIK